MQPTVSSPALIESSSTGAVLVHTGFVLTGVITTLLGPMLPVFSTRWALNDAQAGYLFTAQFATSIVGVALSSVLIHRCGYRLTLLFGIGLMVLGAGLLAQASWAIGLAAVCINGAGYGLASPTSNLLISELNPTRRAAALNLLNFSWGVGAVGCPFVVAALQGSHRTSFFLYGLAGLLALEALCLAFSPVAGDLKSKSGDTPAASAGLWTNRLVPILGALFFIYVGTEVSIGGWVASYARRLDSSPGALWAMTPSFFWGALLLGRALAPVLLRQMREATLASASLGLAAAGVVVLLAAKGMTPVVLGAALAGFGLAPVFPVNIAMLSHWFGKMASRVGGLMFALASLGGATLPWLVGALSTRFGSLKAGLFVPLLGSTLMLALYLANRAKSNTSIAT